MIEITNNSVKCNMGVYEKSQRTTEQEELYERVIEASRVAYKLLDEYKQKYGTDKQGIGKIIRMLNGGGL